MTREILNGGLISSCMSDPCDYEIQILLIDGTCETCFFYEHPDEDGKECVSDDCAGDQVLIEDGTCK